MRLLQLFKGREHSPQEEEHTDTECPHKVLVPRWDSVEDMGNHDKATGYSCVACGATVPLKEAKALQRRHEAITM